VVVGNLRTYDSEENREKGTRTLNSRKEQRDGKEGEGRCKIQMTRTKKGPRKGAKKVTAVTVGGGRSAGGGKQANANASTRVESRTNRKVPRWRREREPQRRTELAQWSVLVEPDLGRGKTGGHSLMLGKRREVRPLANEQTKRRVGRVSRSHRYTNGEESRHLKNNTWACKGKKKGGGKERNCNNEFIGRSTSEGNTNGWKKK